MIITLGGGCFWGVQDTYRKIKGIINTKVGYMNGTEVCQITYDKVSTKYLLEVFFKIHDYKRTTKNQYASVIYYHNEEQKKDSLKLVKELNAVTRVEKANKLILAKESHQYFYKKNPLLKPIHKCLVKIFS